MLSIARHLAYAYVYRLSTVCRVPAPILQVTSRSGFVLRLHFLPSYQFPLFQRQNLRDRMAGRRHSAAQHPHCEPKEAILSEYRPSFSHDSIAPPRLITQLLQRPSILAISIQPNNKLSASASASACSLYGLPVVRETRDSSSFFLFVCMCLWLDKPSRFLELSRGTR